MHTATEQGAERHLAVLGSPIAHSKSPILHAAASHTLGLRWRYEAVRVDGDGLAAFLDSRDDTWLGLSLTMPLKKTVLPLVDTIDQLARLTSAANTVLFERDGHGRCIRRGFNTDVVGIVRALNAAGVTAARHVHVLGGGATAASAIAAAAELGAEHVSLGMRTPSRARPLAELARAVGLTFSVGPFAAEPPHVPDLVVSTLPGSVDAADARAIVRGTAIGAAAERRAAYFDVAYDPWPSPAATAWRELGRHDAASPGVLLSGLPMLVHQALLQVRIFVCGDPAAPLQREDAVLAAMLDAVGLDTAGFPVEEGEPASPVMPES